MRRFAIRRTAIATAPTAAPAERQQVRVRARLVTTSAGTIWVRPDASHTRVQPKALQGIALR
jgi:hypothetical protein